MVDACEAAFAANRVTLLKTAGTQLSAKASLADLSSGDATAAAPADDGEAKPRPPLAGKVAMLRLDLDVELVENDDEERSFSVAPSGESKVSE